jgi:ABC-type transport system substrate-binding protein
MKIKLYVISALVVLSLTLGACTPQVKDVVDDVVEEVEEVVEEVKEVVQEVVEEVVDKPEDEAGDARYPKIVIGKPDDPVDLLPLHYNTRPDIFQVIYETLFDLEEGVYVPRLAKGYTEIDELHWEVELYDYIHDWAGNHIDADDVIYSFEYHIESGTQVKFGLFESIEKVDDYKVLFTWTAPANLVGGLEHVWCRPVIFSQKAFEAGDFATNPVGTGPYTVKEFISGSKIVLEADDNYWQTDDSLKSFRQLQNVQTIEYLIVSEPAQHVIALQTGDMDYSEIIPQESLASFDEGGEFSDSYKVHPRLQGKQWLLVPNQSEGNIGSDKNFRLAIYYAIDNTAMGPASGGAAAGSKAFGSPAFSDYDPAWEAKGNYINTYDPELAKDYLAQSGYDGKTLKLLASNDPETKNITTVVQGFLTSVGINTEITLMDGRELAGLQSDPTAYDICINWIAGGYQIGSWNRPLNLDEFGMDKSMGFIHDETMQEMFMNANTIETHTPENMSALHDYILDHAYLYHLAYGTGFSVYTSDVTEIVYRENTSFIPSACVYNLD